MKPINFAKFGKVFCKDSLKKVLAVSKKHTPSCCFIFGGVNVIVGTILMVKNSRKAIQHVEDKKVELDKDKLTPMETVKATAKDMALPVALQVVGLAFMGTGFVLLKKENVKYFANAQASMSACAIAETQLNSVRKKAVDILGEEKVEEIEKEVKKEQVKESMKEPPNPAVQTFAQPMTFGVVPIRDIFTGNTFYADPQDIKDSIMHTSYILCHGGEAIDFPSFLYDIGETPTPIAEAWIYRAEDGPVYVDIYPDEKNPMLWVMNYTRPKIR